MSGTNEIKLHATFWPALKFGKVAAGLWRFFDCTDGKPVAVGAHYPTKDMIVADVKSYGVEYGFPAV